MTLEGDRHILAQVSLFAAMPVEFLRLVAFTADKRTLKRGDKLFYENDASQAAYVVTYGSFSLTSKLQPEASYMADVGALLSEKGLLTPVTHFFTAEAQEDAAVLVIRPDVFKRALQEFPDVAAHLHGRLQRQLQDFMGSLTQTRAAQSAAAV